MKKSKIVNEKNSLEQFLIRAKKWCEGNKTKAFQSVLVFILVVAAIWVVRANMNGGSSRLNGFDAAHTAATQNYFASADYAPNTQVLQEAANAYPKGETGAEARVELGEAFVRAGLGDVQRKTANSKADKNDEAVAALDPNVNFNAAVAAFEEAAKLGSAEMKARAFYGAGIAKECAASVAADDAQATAALDEAKAYFEKVAASCPTSPFCEAAAKRVASLGSALTVDYYKNVANRFKNLPIPQETESILSGETELTPGETPAVEGFDLNADAETAEAPATQEGVATEETAPAETAAPEAPATEEAAPTAE